MTSVILGHEIQNRISKFLKLKSKMTTTVLSLCKVKVFNVRQSDDVVLLVRYLFAFNTPEFVI
jgi:hypothetical protein